MQGQQAVVVVCYIMRPLPFWLPFFLTQLASGQTEQLSTKKIDSLVVSIDSAKGLRNAIVDGSLRPKGKKSPKGGFSDTYLITPTSKQLVKVERGESLYYSDFTTYYFYQDSLIFVRTVRYNLSGDTYTPISSGQYYFQNGILIDRREQNKLSAKPEVFLQHARRYLIDVRGVFTL